VRWLRPCRSRKRRSGGAAERPLGPLNFSGTSASQSISLWYPLHSTTIIYHHPPSSTIIYHPHPSTTRHGRRFRCSKHCQRVALKLNLPASPHQLKRSDTSCLLCWPETCTSRRFNMWYVSPSRTWPSRSHLAARHRSQCKAITRIFVNSKGQQRTT